MKLIMNEEMMEKRQSLSRTHVLRELSKRKTLDKKYVDELSRSTEKIEGIKTVLNRINAFSQDHWCFTVELSLSNHKVFKCDILLLTLAGAYVFEIHHTPGFFELKTDVGYMNLNKMKIHPVKKAIQTVDYLSNAADVCGLPLEFKGALIFSNPDTKIKLHDEVTAIDVVTADHLDNFLQEIKNDEKEYQGPSMITEAHIRWMTDLYREPARKLEHIPEYIKKNIQKGILCSRCNSFDVEIGDTHLSCACGVQESLEKAAVRTICEYGIINNDKLLEVTELLDFFDCPISEDTLYKYLGKYFMPSF